MAIPFIMVLTSRNPRNTIEIISVFPVSDLNWCAWVRIGGKRCEIREIDGVHITDTFAWLAARKQFAQEGKR